jgi:hypothetical protein
MIYKLAQFREATPRSILNLILYLITTLMEHFWNEIYELSKISRTKNELVLLTVHSKIKKPPTSHFPR